MTWAPGGPTATVEVEEDITAPGVLCVGVVPYGTGNTPCVGGISARFRDFHSVGGGMKDTWTGPK